MRRVALLAAAAATLSLAGDARAWTPIAGSQPTWSGPAPYSLNQNGSEDLGGYEGTLPIVRQGMDDWARVECSALHTSFEGSTTSVPFSSGSNVVGWIESGWIDSPSAIGITGPSWGGSGAIVEAHMAMNGVNFTWTTGSGSGSRVNAYSITLHEAGHYYGLGHSSDGSATMYYAYSGGVSTLNADDEAGICALYPGGGGGTTPDGGGGTEPGPDPGGDAGFCEPCTSDAQCAGTGSRCLRYPDGSGYCGTACGSDAECDGGTCETISDGSRQCVRRDSSGAPDCNAAGGEPAPDPAPDPGPDDGADPGTGDGGCTGDADCAAGERCDPTSGACVPVPRGMLGDACASNEQCASGICAVDVEADDSFCTQLCSDAEPCPTGFECAGVEGGSRACRPMVGGLGDACSAPSDCLSGLCAEDGAGTFCTRECAGVGSCPMGFDCVGAEGGGSLCIASSAGAAPGKSVIYGTCAAVPGRTGGAAWLLLAVAVLPLLRRRREAR